MKLKPFEVVEYTVDKNNNVTAVSIKQKDTHRRLIGNPAPPDDLDTEGLIDKHGRPRWVFKDGKLSKNSLAPPTLKQEAKAWFNEATLLELAKLLVIGIRDKNDKEFKAFAEKIDLIGGENDS